VERETGQAVGAHKVGGLMIARTPDRMDELKRLQGMGRRLGLTYEMLSARELRNCWPVFDTATVLGALYDPMGGHVDPYGLTLAYARGARMRGALIREGWKVESLTPTADGGWLV